MIDGVGVICHLAANPAPSGQAQIDVFDNNVLSAHNLMQAAGDLGVSRVVYASSEMATGLLTEGTVPTQIPFDETERHPSPNAYALSKYISEVIADSLAVRYPQTAWVGLRINNVIAPDGYDRFQDEWDDPSLSKANFWSYIEARDVGSAYRAALEGTSSGHEVCLIAAADTRAKRGLRELMAEYLRRLRPLRERLRGSEVGLRLRQDEGAVRLDPELQLARPLSRGPLRRAGRHAACPNRSTDWLVNAPPLCTTAGSGWRCCELQPRRG